jgi:hypothetical protein
MTSNVENEELRNVLLTDISDLQVSVKNALKRIL